MRPRSISSISMAGDPELNFQLLRVILATYTEFFESLNYTFYLLSFTFIVMDIVALKHEITRNTKLAVSTTALQWLRR